MTDNLERCSFCGAVPRENEQLIEGLNANICEICVEVYFHILESMRSEEMNDPFSDFINSDLTPKSILAELNQEVIGQDHVKKILSVALYNHYKRITSKSKVTLEKSNILLIGPSGVGKTLLAKTMAKILNVPFAICDATAYTQAGYVGEDVENILLRLLQNADYDLELAQKGIVFIDEIDKLARKGENISITRDVSGEGVQHALLKIIEGSVVNVPPQGGRKHPHQEFIPFDTSDVLFICSGAFEGITNIKPKNDIGFKQGDENEKDEITSEQIKKYGIIPELVGRLPIIAKLNKLTENDLYRILKEPKSSIIKQYIELFALDKVNLVFENEALTEIAKLAYQMKNGARSLRTILEQIMLDIMFEIPDNPDITDCIITKDTVLMKGAPELKMYRKDSA
ncbi:MAG: ATP-dependent Clp protease ATP-binding subunit ClpX [Bacilli bacterium]|jgi:ATP-dependent Clp protease ATP-binding subunit ClpX